MKRRALVTGASRRVGRAVALELARSAFDVAIHHRGDLASAEATAADCRALGAEVLLVQGDLAEVSDCERVVSEVTSTWQTLDLLVNNASIFEPLPFEDITVAAWERMQAINLRAPFLLSRGLLPALRGANGALVVHLCDIGANRPVSGYAHYSVSKAGLVMLVKAMAVELAPEVRCMGVSPGQVAWPEWYDQAKRERLSRRIPMGRAGDPADIATLVRFLAVEGTYLNGEIVAVDGGLSTRY